MKRDLPKYVYWQAGAGGKKYPSFQRVRGAAERMKSEPFTDAFWAEYAMLLKGVPPVPKGKTFSALIARYYRAHNFTKLAPRTRKDYKQRLAVIDEKWGHLDPAKMRRRDAIALQANSGKTPHFANYMTRVLVVLMDFAYDIGWLDRNHARGVAPLRYDRQKRQPWPQDAKTRFREAATGKTLLLFEMCIGTGQRIGDVLKMRWSDIEGAGINVTQNKTGTALWVPFTPRLSKLIDEAPRNGLTILTRHGSTSPWSYRSASQAVLKVRRTIGAEGHDIHALRHSAASELAQAGCTDEIIAAVTGQSLPMVQHYTKSVRQKVRALKAQETRK